VSDNAHAVADPHAFKAANYNNAAAMEAEGAPWPFVDGVTVGEFHPEPSIHSCVISGFQSRVIQWNPMEPAMEEEGTMWIAFFSIASAAAVCLSVAAVMIQASQGEILRSE